MMVSKEEVVLIKVGSESIFRKTIKRRYNMPPLGLLHLASVLTAHGYSVRVLDLITKDYGPESLAAELNERGVEPLMVGLSIYTETAPASLELAHYIKRLFPQTAIVAGGPHAMFCPEEVLSPGGADFVVFGEGESTIIELLEALKHPRFPLESVAGIGFRQAGGTLHRTPPRGNILRLDMLPFPAYDPANDAVPREAFYVVSSRGCPGRCSFCSSRAYSGSMYRMHSAEWLISLLIYYAQSWHFRYLDLLDDTFTVDRRRTQRFCALLMASRLHLQMRIKSRVDFIREPVIKTLKEAGCQVIHIGVESADQNVLDAVGKGTTLEEAFSAMELMVRYGIRVDASFMIGHPTDTLKTIEKTIILASTIKEIGSPAVGFSTPYPGTALHARAGQLGLRIEVTNWRKYDTMTPIYSTAHFSLNDLRRAYFMFDRHRLDLKGRTILTGDLHEEYWRRLDRWVERVKQSRAGASGVQAGCATSLADGDGEIAHAEA